MPPADSRRIESLQALVRVDREAVAVSAQRVANVRSLRDAGRSTDTELREAELDLLQWQRKLAVDLRELAAASERGSPQLSRERSMNENWLASLPDVQSFERVAQSLAALDAILSPDWDYRYYSFQAKWSEGTRMASMRDGEGDQWFAVISAAGVAAKGLAHESESFEFGKPKPWVFANLPAEFHKGLRDEPAFETQHSTWCVWRRAGDAGWARGPVPAGMDDGACEQLQLLWAGPVGYREWAAEYYEVELALADVERVFRHEPITPELVKRLNPAADFAALQKDLRGIGYP